MTHDATPYRETRTLVVTIDATGIPEHVWPAFKQSVNHAIDHILRSYTHDGAQIWRRSDDVQKLLEESE